MSIIDWFNEWSMSSGLSEWSSEWSEWLSSNWNNLKNNTSCNNLKIYSWYTTKMNKNNAQSTFFCYNSDTQDATNTIFIPLCFDEKQKQEYKGFLNDISNDTDAKMTWKILSHRPFQEISLKYSSENDTLFYEISNLHVEGDYPSIFGDINQKYTIANGTLKKNWKLTMLRNIFDWRINTILNDNNSDNIDSSDDITVNKTE